MKVEMSMCGDSKDNHMGDEVLVDLLERVWSSITVLCDTLTDTDWQRPTGCPGWNVKDNVAHLIGIEHRLLNKPIPKHNPTNTDHVKNDQGLRNEIDVDIRRPFSGNQILQEFKEVTGERMKLLARMTKCDFSKITSTPIGPRSTRELLAIRIVDCWVHERDIKYTLGPCPNLEGPVSEFAISRLALAMPYVVGKKVRAEDGTVVLFDVFGPISFTLPIKVIETRAYHLEKCPHITTTEINMDSETFICLTTGRCVPREVLKAKKVRFAGDSSLGNNIIYNMNIMI